MSETERAIYIVGLALVIFAVLVWFIVWTYQEIQPNRRKDLEKDALNVAERYFIKQKEAADERDQRE